MTQLAYSPRVVAELLISTPEGKVLANLRLDPVRAYWVGRDSHCEVAVDNSTVSRRHALIFHVNGRWLIADAGSVGGLETEHGPVRCARLSADTWIRVGTVYLWITAAGAAPPDWVDASLEPLVAGRPDQLIRLTNESLSSESPTQGTEALVVTDSRGIVHLCADLSGLAASEGSGTPRLTVGRSTAADLQICDPSIDPIHCVLALGSELWSIIDAGSSSGLMYEGKRWYRKRLEDGITMPVGRFRLSAQRILRTTAPVPTVVDPVRGNAGADQTARKPSAFLDDDDEEAICL